MKRWFIPCVLILAALGAVFTPGGAAGGRIVIEAVTGGRHADAFLDAAEPLVRCEGFKGDFANLVGLSGLGDEATMCRQDCDCRETLHSAVRLQALIAPLHGIVTHSGAGLTSPDEAWGTVETELRAGRPLLAEGLSGPTSLGLIIGCDPQSRTLIYLDHEARRERSFRDWTRENWALNTARLGTTQLAGPDGEIEAVTTMYAHARQPRIEGGCAVRDDRTQNAAGLQAYSLWSEQNLSGQRPDPRVKGARLQGWVERRQMLAQFLHNAAGHQDPDTAARLQSAAGAVEGELKQGLVPLAKSAPVPSPAEAARARRRQSDPKLCSRQADWMQSAAGFEQRFLRTIEPIAFRRLRLPKDAQRLARIDAPKGKASPATLRKLLKSRDPRVRTLGALATARSGDASLAPELTDSLSSPDSVEARTSLAALEAVKPNNLEGLLRQQMDAMRDAGGTVGSSTPSGSIPVGSLDLGRLEGGPKSKDSIQQQMRFAVDDLDRSGAGGPGRLLLAWLSRPPVLFSIAVLVLVGMGILLWKLVGPKRLATKLDDIPFEAIEGLPEEAARLERLLANPPATGLLLTHVARGETAEKQGLKPGDVITRYGGLSISGLDDLRRAVGIAGPRRREIVARRDWRIVKTVVPPGPLGLSGVAVTRGVTYWKRLETAPYSPDFSGIDGEGESWYRITRNGRACGFESRNWRWVHKELEVQSVTGLAGDDGDESARVTHKLRAGDRLTCTAVRFSARGQRSIDTDASCSGDRWIILVDGKAPEDKIPAEALPSRAMALFAATLPFEAGRAYNVVRFDEFDFEPAYGCQVICQGSEPMDVAGAREAGGGVEQGWRFELKEYGVRQMTFWFDARRQLLKAEYAGLVFTRTPRETVLAGVTDRQRALLDEPWRARKLEPAPTEGPATQRAPVPETLAAAK